MALITLATKVKCKHSKIPCLLLDWLMWGTLNNSVEEFDKKNTMAVLNILIITDDINRGTRWIFISTCIILRWLHCLFETHSKAELYENKAVGIEVITIPIPTTVIQIHNSALSVDKTFLSRQVINQTCAGTFSNNNWFKTNYCIEEKKSMLHQMFFFLFNRGALC